MHFFLAMHISSSLCCPWSLHFYLAMLSLVPATSTVSVYVIASDMQDQQVARDQMFHDMQCSTKAVLTTIPLLWDKKVHITNLYKEKPHEYETNSICFV